LKKKGLISGVPSRGVPVVLKKVIPRGRVGKEAVPGKKNLRTEQGVKGSSREKKKGVPGKGT